jgi:hypothetical protein
MFIVSVGDCWRGVALFSRYCDGEGVMQMKETIMLLALIVQIVHVTYIIASRKKQ